MNQKTQQIAEPPPRNLTADALLRLKKNKLAMLGLVVVVLYILVSALAPILPLYSHRFQVLDHRDLPPSFRKTAGELWYERELNLMLLRTEQDGRSEPTEEEQQTLAEIEQRIATETAEIDGVTTLVHSRRYLLGTDYLGRDLLSRIIFGSQISVAVGLLGTVTSMLIGIFAGSIAGFFGGVLDTIIMRIVDVMYGLPYILLVIIFMAIFGNNIYNIFLALAIVSWLTASRVVRGQIMSLKNQEFIEAAQCMGATSREIITRHLIPNSLSIIIVFGTLRIPTFILLEAFLSFLGLGISAPFASWGTLISDSVNALNVAPWRLFFPSAAMSIFLLSMNFFGDGLRDAFDPKSKFLR